jgi:hypothetical protein
MMAPTCNSSTREAEAGLQSETLSETTSISKSIFYEIPSVPAQERGQWCVLVFLGRS